MADKKQKSEPEFIRGTVLASILLLLIFIAAGVVFARNPDAVRGAAVRTALFPRELLRRGGSCRGHGRR